MEHTTFIRLLRPTAIVLALVSALFILAVVIGFNLSILLLLLTFLFALWSAWCLWHVEPRNENSSSQLALTKEEESHLAPLAATNVNGAKSSNAASGIAAKKVATARIADNDDEATALHGGKLITGGASNRFLITYRDGKGRESERDLLVYAVVERKGNIVLDGYSQDQISCRSYRADRVIKLTDKRTGKVVKDNIIGYLEGLSVADLD